MSSLSLQVMRRKGGRYVTLIESFIDPVTRKKTSRTIKSYGYIDKKMEEDPKYFEKLKEERDRLKKDWNAKDALRSDVDRRVYPDIQGEAQPDAYEASARLVYGDAAIRSVWEEMDLDKWFKKARRNAKLGYDFDLAAFYMVAGRILCPASRLKMMRNSARFFFDYEGNLTLDNLYDALGQLAKRRKTLINYINNQVDKVIARDVSLVFYDVTTFYFESFNPDKLRQRGMSKEHRTHETQVVMGLLIDSNGIPLNYEMFAGNAAETKTILTVVDEYRSAKPDGKVVVVADRGLNSKNNLGKLRKRGCHYIVAHSLQELSRKDQQKIFDDEGWKESFDPETGELLTKIKSFPLPETEDSAPGDSDNPDGKSAAVENDARLIVSWSAKRFYNDMKELDAQWNQAKKMLSAGKGLTNASFKRGSRQFIKAGKENSCSLNESLHEKKKKFAGFCGLVTSCRDMTDGEAYGRLRELWQIEENFRIMKSLLCSRPIYVRTEQHIRGHFLVCVLALTIERIMHKRLREAGHECSFEYMAELLTSPTLSPIATKRNKVQLYLKTAWFNSNPRGEGETNMGSEADRIMKVFGIEPVKNLETLTDLRQRLKVHLPLAAKQR